MPFCPLRSGPVPGLDLRGRLADGLGGRSAFTPLWNEQRAEGLCCLSPPLAAGRSAAAGPTTTAPGLRVQDPGARTVRVRGGRCPAHRRDVPLCPLAAGGPQGSLGWLGRRPPPLSRPS